jgi:hypothetical protein
MGLWVQKKSRPAVQKEVLKSSRTVFDGSEGGNSCLLTKHEMYEGSQCGERELTNSVLSTNTTFKSIEEDRGRKRGTVRDRTSMDLV